MSLYELRTYRIRSGGRADWVRLMDETVLPFMRETGMDVLGAFVPEDDPDVYIWIRRFADEADRVVRYAAVYQSDRWKQELLPRIDELLIREDIVVTRLVPTPGSPHLR